METEGDVHVQVECDCKLRQGINGMFVCKGTDGNPDMCIDKAGKLYAPGAKLPRDDKVRAHFLILVCNWVQPNFISAGWLGPQLGPVMPIMLACLTERIAT